VFFFDVSIFFFEKGFDVCFKPCSVFADGFHVFW
jgi:hypothetical protein